MTACLFLNKLGLLQTLEVPPTVCRRDFQSCFPLINWCHSCESHIPLTQSHSLKGCDFKWALCVNVSVYFSVRWASDGQSIRPVYPPS